MSVTVALCALWLACSRSELDLPIDVSATGGTGIAGSGAGTGGGPLQASGGSLSAPVPDAAAGGTTSNTGGTASNTGGTGGTAGAASALREQISVQGCRDVAHDAKRGLLYISTESDGVLRYDLARRQFLEPFALEGALMGMDLSPDQDTLLVADQGFVTADASTLARNWIHVVELGPGSTRKIVFSDELYEAGTYMPVFVADGDALVSSSYPGSGLVPLRRVDLADDSYVIVTHMPQDTALMRSADGSVIAYAGSNLSNGPFGYYRIDGGTMREATTQWFNHTIGVNRDATQYAVPTYYGMFVYDGTLQEVGLLGEYADVRPGSVVYSPVSDVVYLFWEDYAATRPSVEAYDTTTLAPLAAIDPSPALYSGVPFAPGQMRMSRDGSWLFVIIWDGVRVYELEP